MLQDRINQLRQYKDKDTTGDYDANLKRLALLKKGRDVGETEPVVVAKVKKLKLGDF